MVEWADANRYIPPESGSTPGKWRTDKVEAARGPMLAVTEPGVTDITVMCCTQLMKTELINNVVAYYIAQDPSPMIVLQPTLSLATMWSKDRFTPTVRDTPILNQLVKRKKSRDSDNTLFRKSFPGGQLSIVTANSPSELASRPVRIVLADEIDKYEDTVEGDALSLIRERTATFWNRLVITVCSPTIKGSSKIEARYLQSDQRIYKVPCYGCGHRHEMQWAHVKWDNDDPDTAAYYCPECGIEWTEHDRLSAIKQGVYEATAPFNGHAGFRVNKLASPWEPLPAMVKKWLAAQGNIGKLKAFVNTQLAETWEEKGEAPEWRRLYERRETYKMNKIPDGVVFLTAAADVQKDRIECEIVGWGRNRESWSIDYRVFSGDTSTPEPYKGLDDLLGEQWLMSNGELQGVRKFAIDSGYNTTHVTGWARKHPASRVHCVKGDGDNKLQTMIGTPKAVDMNSDGKRARYGVKTWPVGVNVLKEELYSLLNLDGAGDDGKYPHGYCHFPQYDEEHFKQLTAEALLTKVIGGREVKRWVKQYERNERLDIRNYNRAMANLIGIDRFTEAHWNELEGHHRVINKESGKPATNFILVGGENNNSRPTKPESSFWAQNNPKKKSSFW